MVALTRIDVELVIMGIPFDQELWLDFMGVILLDPAEGLNSIKAVWQLAEAKTNPLLDNPTTWQLMEGKFKDRYKFNEWKTVFDQVFEASHEGTAIEVARDAMTECGVLDCPSVHNVSPQASSSANISHTLPFGQASSSQPCKASRRSKGPLPPAKHLRSGKIVRQFLDTSAQDSDNNKSEHESDQDSEVHRSPRATEIAPLGCTTFNKHLEHIFHHYNHEGSAEGSNAQLYQSPVRRAEVSMGMDVGPIESRVYMIELPTSLPPSHTDLVREVMQIPPEQMQSVMKPCNIPICSWVCVFSGAFKNDIAYVLSIENSLVETLIVPRSLPYYSNTYNSVSGHSLFDMELAREHGLEVTISTNDCGHPITYCNRSEYHFGCSHIYFPKNQVKVVSVPSPDEVAWFAVACIDPSLVDHTLTHFSTQWWQDGDTGRICLGEFASKLAHIVAMDLQCESVTVHVLTDSSSDDVGALEISIHDFKLEFPTGTSVKVIAGLDCGFQGMGNDQQLEVLGIFLASYISLTTYASQAHDQVQDDPLANENHLQPGDVVCIISSPHKDLCGMLQYYSCDN
ncbi:hypothetical protein F5141DRAFT_1208376 [Pisolithus sp. B1]|nr:hypothetical protein F5141DRAFT_1208376 [Pisolithus sp. B1]